MTDMRRILLTALVLVGIALVGTQPNALADAQTNPTYSSAALGFSLKYPDTWQLRENPNGRTVMFVDATVKKGYLSSVTVTAGPVKPNVTLVSADRLIQDTFTTILTDYKLYKKESGSLGGSAATQLLFTARQGKFLFAGFVVYTVRAGRLYSFTFECDRQNYDRLRATGGTILGSFTFL